MKNNIGHQEIQNQCNRFALLFEDPEQPNKKQDFLNSLMKMKDQKVVSISELLGLKVKQQIFSRLLPHNTSCDTSAAKSFSEDQLSDSPSQWANNLNYKEIESMLIDKKVFKFVEKNETKMVLLQDVPERVSYYGFLDFISSLKKKPNISRCHFCFFEGKYSMVCYFEEQLSMEMFLASIKKQTPHFEKFFGTKTEARNFTL